MRVAAVGAGRMGRGIAIAFAAVGREIAVIDIKAREPAALIALRREAMGEIARDLRLLVQIGLLDDVGAEAASARVTFVGRDDAPQWLADCDVVFEGVPETLAAKQACFEFILAHIGPTCIVASTSSSMGPETLSPFMANSSRFLNAHWLNPAYLIPLVEVAPSPHTSAAAREHLLGLLRDIGKVPILCNGAPGYIVPRIQALAMNEAARMVEEGVATAEDLDQAIRVGFGVRFAVLGLLEFIDWGGGDILMQASSFLADRIDHHRFAPPDVIRDNMVNNRRGLRDGKGFYDYADVNVDDYRAKRLNDFATLLRVRNLLPPFRQS